VIRITQACTDEIERQIREHPQYWLWMHRRWKTRPADSVESEHLRPPDIDMEMASTEAGPTNKTP
jgi:hypothetical protein